MDIILIDTLRQRFEKNANRHPGIKWEDVLNKLEASPLKFDALRRMEDSNGEPDVVGFDETSKEFLFFDCSPESPAGRRSLCYDQLALDSRKENKPKDSALNVAADMGVELLTEEQYRYLQQLGKFDQKTSSWIITPDEIRTLKGALFADFRYGKTFIYHNGAESYYAARGFRAVLK
ncbi:MAG: DUF4256 domain-containing protein, partial [Flavobacterium sp.]